VGGKPITLRVNRDAQEAENEPKPFHKGGKEKPEGCNSGLQLKEKPRQRITGEAKRRYNMVIKSGQEDSKKGKGVHTTHPVVRGEINCSRDRKGQPTPPTTQEREETGKNTFQEQVTEVYPPSPLRR